MDEEFGYGDVLEFWFPQNGHWESAETHREFWNARMQGGMDAEIRCRFGPVTEAAARGQLDHWADTPRGRLALLLTLDQFPRSYWRDAPGAFAQDIKAARLALEALENGHYHALDTIWERQFYIIAISHCEGPDHMARMDLAVELSKAHAEIAPPGFEPMVALGVEQSERVREIIARFGRHPHRNQILGRMSSPEEEAYVAAGDFPHQRRVESEVEASSAPR